ncbi:MAG: hypothetical protein E7647_02875 [Ruminococcaceae bacterium]|nr:hypothetical protein [Oscillospiraceae bacterium]
MFYLKLSFCIAAVFGYGILLWLYPFGIFTFVLGAAVCNWIANLFHETGHFIAYNILALNWKRTVISWFVFERGRGLRIDKKKRLYSASCTCEYHPEVAFWRYCVALLSGGLFCVVLSAAALVLSFFSDGALRSFLLCFGAVSLVNALANLLIPQSPDRAYIRRIKQEREKKE